MSAIIPFLFEGTAMVRTVERGGEPWFVAVDVCRCLELTNSRKAVAALDEDEKGVTLSDTPGGQQEVAIISESGLYTLILRSRKATTPGSVQHRFRKWVTADVLPTIRKTGGYGGHRTRAGHLLGQRQAVALMDKLKVETSPAIRRTLHAMLHEILAPLGVETPALDAIGREAPPPPDLLGPFWNNLDRLREQGMDFNHSLRADLLALRLPDLAGHVVIDTGLRWALKQSTHPAFVAVKAVASRITGGTVKAWVFRLFMTGPTSRGLSTPMPADIPAAAFPIRR